MACVKDVISFQNLIQPKVIVLLTSVIQNARYFKKMELAKPVKIIICLQLIKLAVLYKHVKRDNNFWKLDNVKIVNHILDSQKMERAAGNTHVLI